MSAYEVEKLNALNLGWYYSENKEEFQLAKIAEKAGLPIYTLLALRGERVHRAGRFDGGRGAG
jgi:hypothetical protein